MGDGWESIMIGGMRTVGLLLCGLLCLGGVGGCTPAVSEGDFYSPDPGTKLYAISRAGQTRDRSAIGHLIEQLESDDQAVRMYAIVALERITGTRMGYVYHAPPHERQPAVQRWVVAYRSGELSEEGQAVEAADGEQARADQP